MYELKVIGMKFRIDFFFLVKNLIKSVKKIEIYLLIVFDYKVIYMFLFWLCEILRGFGFWKFNNIFLKDEEYVEWVCKIYLNIVRYYC